jgi:VWFA-related protein
VSDQSGAPVRELSEQEFTLLEDNRPQKIVSFNSVNAGATALSDPPVEIILVVDAVNASLQVVNYERDQVKKFLLRNGGQLAQPVSLVFFSGAETAQTRFANPSSRDGNALAVLYDQYETGLRATNLNRGAFGAEERFDLSHNVLKRLAEHESTRPGRKLVIWLSPGWPLLSGINTLSPKQEQRFFDAIVAASTELRQARITLYSVNPLRPEDVAQTRSTLYQEFLKGVTSPSQALPGALGLQVLAVQSGGRVLNFPGDLTTAIADCAADGDSFYVFSFSPVPANHENEYHSFRVTVEKPEMTARTRAGYYAQP